MAQASDQPKSSHRSIVPHANSKRPIRSFVRRQGRMTAAQKKALETLWPVYGLDPKLPIVPEIVFGRSGLLTVEIGFGNGGTLADHAETNPEIDFVGIEVHEPGIGHLMQLLAGRQIENVRIFKGDAVDILGDAIEDAAIDRLNLFFPDPWPKKRHHKRRLVSAEFAELVCRKLKPGGYFHVATDWEDYAVSIVRTLEACDRLSNIANTRRFREIAASRSQTRFERRGLSLGHKVHDIVFVQD
jgi:tRNA (guanine-N7-)-methyltransferase